MILCLDKILCKNKKIHISKLKFHIFKRIKIRIFLVGNMLYFLNIKKLKTTKKL